MQTPAGFDAAARVTSTAERGLFDFVVADDFAVLAALAAITNSIGLVAAVDTTGSAPFDVARRLATLDHLSEGRAGWMVSSGLEAEFVAVVTGFWDSWAPGAVVADRDSGRYVDSDRIQVFEHRGPRFDVRGVATLPARPQGHPVLVRGFSFLEAGTATPDEVDRDEHAGFVLAPADLDGFVDTAVPLLQRRERFRTEYAGDTLRAHLGL
ncbi:LLM class flavin-dependent oxidoreductase [Mycobacterium sp. 236(2023)]|uniref:LLM class flavin-dependent oxidoreductase n=1 Tax=Mycobacterium sp. 236(2023) TaxID=3038163 RepID=UPI0024150EA4|nr:LLM class flavin-dependent oxidoreductase [Mycobacterium sp. 236(2023)]MDG4663340.1 LLM class flavin-dependent oxidoreductase [Mycobacterium sp. 236(2023)]